MIYFVIHYCSSNTIGSALTLLCISSNITAVAVLHYTVLTLVVFLYFQVDIRNLYDRPIFKFH